MFFSFDTSNLTPAQQTGITIGSIVYYIIQVIVLWRVFSKAGRPGWLAIIPIVNIIVVLRVSGHSGWWILLMWIPIVGLVLWLIFSFGLARNFGHGGAFAFFLLWLFYFIGFLILAFSSNTWHDRNAVAAA